jgi:hypothetical protein
MFFLTVGEMDKYNPFGGLKKCLVFLYLNDIIAMFLKKIRSY